MSYYFNIINRRQVTITDDEEKNYILHPCLSQNQSINKSAKTLLFFTIILQKDLRGCPPPVVG